MSNDEVDAYETDSDGSFSDKPPAPIETTFQKQLKQGKRQLGRNYGHSAFYYKYSEAMTFINLKKSDPKAKLYYPGSFVWIANKRDLYEPAKVIKAITYSKVAIKAKKKALKKSQLPKSGNVRELIMNTSSSKIDFEKDEMLGQVVVQSGEDLVILNVNANAAKHLIPMRPEHITPSNVLDVNIDDLSSASIMYNLRYQFETKDESCLLIGDKTLIYLNRFLSREDEMFRGIEKKMARRNGETEDTEPMINISSFAETLFNNLNRRGGREPQSCVITGNKFSNRRNVTKEFTTRVIQLSQANDATWYDKLQAADEILTMFGGENFLRWTELHMKYIAQDDDDEEDFQKGKLTGAAFQSFLLDTSNLINKDAKTFNIFHQLCFAAKRSAKRKAKEEKVQEKRKEERPKTWREKQEEKKNSAKNLSEKQSKPPKKVPSKKKIEDIDFLEDLDDMFSIRDENSYFYLNNGVLPKYRFTPEEVKDYFEDPEVKRKRLEAERLALEEKKRIEEEKRLEEERQKQAEKDNITTAADAKRLKKEKAKKRRRDDAQIAKRLNIKTLGGKGNKNKYLENLQKTKERNEKKKKSMREELQLDGLGFANAKHFFEKTPEEKASDASTRRPSGKSQAELAKEIIQQSPVHLDMGQAKDELENSGNQTAGEKTEEKKLSKNNSRDEVQPLNLDESDEEAQEEPEEEESDEDEELLWERTLENLETLNVKKSEIASMIVVLRDILEFGNILVCNIKRTDGKKKHAEIVDTISDDEKDEELVEKKVDVAEIYNTKKQKSKTLPKLKISDEPDDGKQVINDVAVDFLIEKKLLKKNIFGVRLRDLVSVLNVRKLKFGKEEILKPVGKNKSLARRDALVRALYAGMFNWLLSTINRGISVTREGAQSKGKSKVRTQIGIIAILEAIGLVTELDSLNSNGLDQLITNYAMEKLHSFQTIHILEEHAKVYKDNGLTVPFTEGNELVLPLILGQTKNLDQGIKAHNKKNRHNKRASFSRTFTAMNSKVRENDVPTTPQNKYQRNKKTLGILDICEEMFTEPKGNDKKLIERIMKDHRRHQNMLISKSRYAFKIQHFGAKVSYHVKGFVKRMWSSVLDEEVREFMINNTKDKLVADLLSEHSTAVQQEKLDNVYKRGMKQIKEGIAVEKQQIETEMAEQGPLILSPHTVNVNNSRLKRDNFIMPTTSKPNKTKRKAIMSVSRGITGMTMTLNLAGITRARNANGTLRNGAAKQSSMQAVPVSGGSKTPRSLMYTKQGGMNQDGKAKNTEGVRTTYNTLKTLIVMLDVTDPHFIHCIPTNKEHQQNSLDVMYTYEQLKIAGIVPFFGYRFRESSFGIGIEFEEFRRKFWPLYFVVKPENRDQAHTFMTNIQGLGAIPRGHWKAKKRGSKIFLKLGSLSDIETLSDTAFNDMIIFIQKYWRMCLTRKLYFVLLQEKYERQIDKGCAENDLSALTTVVGKSNFFGIKPSNLYLANGKIKRLRKELKLRKKLEAVTKSGTITEIYGVLNEAKDAHLPRCPEFIAAITKYKKLDYEANVVASTARKQLKKEFLPVLGEIQEIQQEDADWENGGAEEFALEIERMLREQEEFNKQENDEEEVKPTKLEEFFDKQQSKTDLRQSKRRVPTFRYGELGELKNQAIGQSFNNLQLVDDADSVDMEELSEYDEAQRTPYATARTASQNGSIASNITGGTADVEAMGGGSFDEGIGSSAMLPMDKYNDMVSGKNKSMNMEGAPRRASSIFNIFSTRQHKTNYGKKTKKRKGFFSLTFLRGKKKKQPQEADNSHEKTSDEENIRNVLGEDTPSVEGTRDRNKSWELDSNDSLIRVDVEQPPIDPQPQERLTWVQRVRSSIFSRSMRRSRDKA